MLNEVEEQQQDYQEEPSSYRTGQGTYQNPHVYQKLDEDNNDIDEPETNKEDVEWELDENDTEYHTFDIAKTNRVKENFSKMYVGEAYGMIRDDSRDAILTEFAEHMIHWLHLHNFTRNSAHHVANQLRRVIIVDGVVSGFIMKSTKDVIIPEEGIKKKKGRHHRRRHRHRHRHRHEEEAKVNQDPDKKELDPSKQKPEVPSHQFAIKINYRLNLGLVTEQTCFAVCYPVLGGCCGWPEPIVDKEYRLTYNVDITRVRGKQDVKMKSNWNELEADVHKKEEKKTVGGMVSDLFSAGKEMVKTDKEEEKEEKKEKKHRRHGKHGKHRKGGSMGSMGSISMGSIGSIGSIGMNINTDTTATTTASIRMIRKIKKLKKKIKKKTRIF
jgi:hypothetical protein